MKKKLKLGLSTCPNDTFIFYGLLSGKIDSPFLIDPYFADVEDLNHKAAAEELAICKISIHAFCHIADNYLLSQSGGALGNGCGPLLLAPQQKDWSFSFIKDRQKEIEFLVPGIWTTALLYLKLAFPEIEKIRPMLFSDIMPSLSKEEFGDALGLIIHESRFTYRQYGLKQILDLGKWWESKTNGLIPLGGIALHKSLSNDEALIIEKLIQSSIDYAWKNQAETLHFCRHYAQEIADEVMLEHIKLYVNEYSRDMGLAGKSAIHKLFTTAYEAGVIDKLPQQIFVEA